MIRLALKSIFLIAFSFFSSQYAFTQTTITFNELGNQLFTPSYSNSGFTFSINATNGRSVASKSTGGFSNSPTLYDNNPEPGGITRWTITKNDGAEFQFRSIYLRDAGLGGSTSGSIQGFKNGNSTGAAVAISFNGIVDLAGNSQFFDVDELRIQAADINLYLDHFTFGVVYIPVDSEPTQVTSISVVGIPLTTATSVSFNVLFSKTAKNVSSDDFILTTAGATGTISSVSGSGSSYTVAVNGISGEGTVRLDLKGGTNIANANDFTGTTAYSLGQPHTVSACFVETFETETDAGSSFSGNGVNFSLGTGLEIEKRTGFGAGLSNGFVKNNETAGSFSLSGGTEFTMSTIDLFLSDQTNGDNPTAAGTIVITGKKGGAEQFTISKSTGFPTSTTVNGGFFTINFATDGAGNYRNTNVDELEFTISGGFRELAIDNFNFCKAVPLVDTQAPVVQSISIAGNPLSTASSVNFQVIFNENASNVTLDDFTLLKTGTANGTLTSLSGSGFNYTLGVTGVSGEGSLQVKLNSGTNIQDALGNTPPFEFLNGQIHLVGACYIETFESFTNGATSFSSNGKAFTLGGNWAAKDRSGFGINSSNKFLENTGTGTYSIAVDEPVRFSRLALFLTSNAGGNPLPTNNGTLTIRGKNGATTAYTITKSTGFPTNFSTNSGYFYLDFSTEGGADNSGTFVDGLEIEIGGSFIYLALDNLQFCQDFEAPSGYTVAIDQAQIDDANAAAASFTFAGAEVDATYDYTFSSDGGGTNVTGSGTVATLTDQITPINLSGLGGGTVTLSVTLTDPSGNTGAVATDTKQRIVNAAPVATAPAAPTVSEDTSAELPDDIEITDGEGDDQTVTFTITGGTLFLGTTGVTFGGDGNGSASFTASGTLAAINTALDAATFTPIANLFGADVATIAFMSNDGTVDSNTASVTFSVAGVNDDPTISGLPTEVTVTEDGTTDEFDISSATIGDIDAGSGELTLTLAATGGTFDIAAGISSTGNLSNLLTLTGNLGDLNNYLNSPSNIWFIPNSNLNGDNAASVSISINDNGNTGSGGGNDIVIGTVNIDITPVNDAPTVANPIPNQSATEDAAFNFQFAANTFEDVDPGSTLAYTAELAGGGPLPAWLSFDGLTRTFSGTPTNANVGTVSIQVAAADGNGESVFDVFDIVVANVNSAPTVANPIPNQSATEDAAFNFQFAANTFADVDLGNTLTYTAELDGGGLLPAWLSFDGLTRTFSGTPTNANVGTVSIKVTADDGNLGTISDSFDIVVANVNDAPTVANPIPDQDASEDAAFNFQFAANTFEDVDLGSTLAYTAELAGGGALPAWLSFDATTRTFSGTPTNANVGTVSIQVTADDGNFGTISDSFDIVVANSNDAPSLANPIPDQGITEDVAFNFQFAANTFEDVDPGATLTYTAELEGGGLLPAWLSFTPLTRTFSGTPTNANVGTISIKVTADDGNLGTISDSFDIVVANVNDAPTVANPIPNQSATEDAAFNFQFAVNTFADVDLGNTLTYTAELAGGGALPAWLSFDAATRTFSGTPTNANVGTVSIKVTAADENDESVFDEFNIVVAAINDAPVNSVPGPQVTSQDVSLLFSNGEGNQISISDLDAGASNVKLSLTATNGVLTLSGTAGLAFTLGDGTSDESMEMEGSISDVNNALNGLIFTPASGYYGAAVVQISTNDLGNTGSGGPLTDTDEIQVTVNSINPVVTGVSSTTANGTYGVDSPIVVAVIFNQDILVNTAGGTPSLLLETGSTDREAIYSSGSGSETLFFTYTVVAGDASADLDYQSTSALLLNGATLKNIPGDDAVLTLPSPGATGSLGANKDLVIDAIKPSGYSVLIDQDPIITTNQAVVSFTFAGAEVGATFNYSFSSSGGGTSVSGSGTVASMTQQVAGIDLTGLAIGTITLNASLTDPIGNIGDEVSDTSQKLAPITAAITAQTDVACNGDNTGSLTVEVSGGMANYTYSWSDGTIVTGTSSTTNDLNGLIAGGYSVTVTDENGQIAVASATIIEPSALLVAIVGQTDVSCFGGSDGSATVSVSGGTGEYSYSWAPSGGDAAKALGLTVGLYTVTVTDANGCSASQSFDISQPTALVASTSQIDAVCGVGGSASVTPSGGAGGYTYLWSSGSTSSVATGLTSGNHSVLITDINGCELTKNFTIGGAFILNATTSQSDVSCFGGNDGSATVTVQEGTGPFDYQWTGGGGTGATASGLAAGPYSVTVTDANNCSTVLNVTITQPATASLTTAAVTGVTFSSATLGGTISTSDIGCASETGVVYSTSPGPDLTDSKEVMTITGGEFSEVISGLALTTTYYAKAYSTNSNGITVYGNEVSFTTSDLTVLTVTANAQTKVFGQADPALTYTYTGLNPGDDISSVLTGALSREIGEDVGDYAIEDGTLSVIPGSGYALSYVGADFSITPATVTGVTFTGESFVYDGTVKSLAITGTLPTGTSANYTGNNRTGVGTQEVTATITGLNYEDLVLKADLTVTPATLDIIADAGQTKIYGTVDPTLAYSSTGLIAGDNITGALGRVSGESVGLYAINQGTLSAGINYAINFTPADFEITKASLNVTANAGQSKVYGNADPTFAYTTTGFENGDTDVILTGTLDRVAGEGVGAYAIGLGTLSAGANYTVSYAGADFEITPATLNVTANAGQSKIYGNADPTFTYTANGFQNGDTNSVFTGALDRTAGEAVGVYAIGLGSISAGANYTINYIGADFTIGSQLLQVTVTAGQSKVYGDADPAFTYTVTGFENGDTNTILTGNLQRTAGENVGLYAISQGTLSAGSNYSINFTSANFEITKAILNVTADAGQTKVYGDTDPTLTYTATGFQNGDTNSVFSGTLERTAGENVGLYAISQGMLSAGANYTINYVGTDFEITKATLNVTATAEQSKVYGNADPLFTYTATGFQNGDSYSVFSGTLERTAGENVGLYAINQGTLSAGINYTINFTPADFEITKATLNVTANAGQSKVYGNADPVFAYTATGFENGDSYSVLTGALDRVAGETVGIYAIGLGTLSAGTNYSINYTGADFTIGNKLLQVIVTAGQSKVYGNGDPVFAYTATGFENGDSYSVFSGTLERTAGENVGLYAISQGTLSAGGNYTINFTSADFEITKAILNVTANAGQTKVYGNADPTFTYTANGFQNGDTNSVFSGTLERTAGENVGLYAINQGTLSAGGNYAINYVGADLEITQATLDVTATAGQSKVYGDADPVFGYTATGFENGDTDAVLVGTLQRAAGENIGLYAINQGTLSAGGNYAINYVGADFEITKATLDVTANAGQSKIYGNADPVFTYTATGFENGDTNSILSGTLQRAAGENVGMYAINQGTLSAGSNYTINFTPADFEITKATLNVTADAGQTKVYGNADPTFTYTATGFQNGDTNSVLSGTLERTVGENVGLYAISQGMLSAGGNYTINFTSADFEITKAILNVTANAGQTKVYGNADPTFAYTANGFQNGDTNSVFSGNLERTAGENVGLYAINQGTLSAGGNYAINYVGADFEITVRTLQIAANPDQAKVYGSPDPVFAFTATNFGNGDTEGILTGALTREAGENIGEYAILLGNLTAGSNYVIDFTSTTFTIAAKVLNVTADSGQSKVFGTMDPVFTYVVSGFENGDNTSILTGELQRVSGENVGAYAINLGSLHAGENYAINFTGADFVVTKATITGISLAGASSVFDGSAKSLAITGTLPAGTSVAYTNNSRTNVGTQEVTATITGSNYTTLVLTADLTITPATISSVTFADGSFIYDGTAKSLAITGTLPAGTSVVYTNNSRTNVGAQEATATITGSNYTTLVLTADLTITPATISGITFADGSFIYDGTAKSLAITGTLPAGTSVAYTNNSRTNIGTQEVTATITGSNYTTLVLTADLTITPATITGLTFADGSFTYDGTAKSLTITGTLPAGTSVAYTDNSRTNVGAQEATATITGSNYTTLVLTAELTITPATVSGVTFADGSFTYDGTAKSLAITGTLPAGTSVAYTNNSRTNVGMQEVTATITGSDYTTEVLKADLTISPATLVITANAGQSKLYGAADPVFTYTAFGFQGSDTESIVTGTLTRALGEEVGSYAITIGTLAAGSNYTIDYTGSAFEILSNDTDGDGVPDEIEEDQGTDPTDPGDYQDTDGDKVPDYVEEQTGTDPSDPTDYVDTDEDQVPDYAEEQTGTDPADETDFKDEDGDGVPDYVQQRAVTEFVTESLEAIWGTLADELTIPTEVVAITSKGEFVNLTVTWDLTGYDGMTSGSTTYSGTAEVTDGLFNPYDLQPMLEVNVLAKPAPQDVTLSANSFVAIPDVYFQEIGVFTVMDPTDNVHTLSLSSGTQDNDYFEVLDGILFWSSAEQAGGKTSFTILLTVKDRTGNVLDKTFQISRLRTPLDELDVPNTFTPNADGTNDNWGVLALRYYTGVRISVLDLGGERLFYTENPDVQWDGTFNGKEMPVGSYLYIIEVGETGEIRRGMLNLLRQ